MYEHRYKVYTVYEVLFFESLVIRSSLKYFCIDLIKHLRTVLQTNRTRLTSSIQSKTVDCSFVASFLVGRPNFRSQGSSGSLSVEGPPW